MRRYDALCRPLQPEQDYVFLALHYQPERATVPLGGVFGDQTLIVDMLAKTLPKDWKLYVKEHPWQLQPFGWGEMQRTQEFYDTIAGYPNVVLVSRDVETSELVSGSKAVATVTGSVGWDALCSGIPVLVFGAAWYRDCAGVTKFPVRPSWLPQFRACVRTNRQRWMGSRHFAWRCHACACRACWNPSWNRRSICR
jgi:capsule polysaccharide export protein KpsC/LpsZ